MSRRYRPILRIEIDKDEVVRRNPVARSLESPVFRPRSIEVRRGKGSQYNRSRQKGRFARVDNCCDYR